MKRKERIFPRKGLSRRKVEAQLAEFRRMDTDAAHGRLTVDMHMGTEEVNKVALRAFNMFFHRNAFLAEYETGMRQMQREVLAMAVEILKGGEDARANITSGGTDSIFCAMHAARQWARDKKPEVKAPEIVVPFSGHAAFNKSCRYLDIKEVRVPVGGDYRADVQAMEKAITPNTIALVGSAPCWPFGVIDPIDELGKLAQKRGLWLHSDCCVGGYISPWLEKLGMKLPRYDFRVPGVSSISADIHKHGYAAKPCSTVLYRSEDLQKYHWVPVEDWPVGHYQTQSLVGSRPAGALAAAWAVMKHLGEKGYVALAKRSLEVKKRMEEGIASIEDFWCIKNDSLLILYRSDTLDMLCVMGGMVERGYFPFGTFNPPFVQINAEPVSDEVVDAYLADLREVAKGVREGKITAQALARYG